MNARATHAPEHAIRHAFTTRLVRAGRDAVSVTELTGRARLETVRSYSLPKEQDEEPTGTELSAGR